MNVSSLEEYVKEKDSLESYGKYIFTEYSGLLQKFTPNSYLNFYMHNIRNVSREISIFASLLQQISKLKNNIEKSIFDVLSFSRTVGDASPLPELYEIKTALSLLEKKHVERPMFVFMGNLLET